MDVAKKMVEKGILAMDESTGTIGKRFESIKLQNTEHNRKAYRQMLLTAKGLGKFISGAILYEETLRQSTDNGISIVDLLKSEGIVPGIKVDKGAVDFANFPNEKIAEGLDGLRERLKEYAKLGAQFAKWRAVITIGEDIPSQACIDANAHALALYAGLCQEQEIIPIVEPEVLMDGNHGIQMSYEVTSQTLRSVFSELVKYKVNLKAMILKPNMVLSGYKSSQQASPEIVADMTIKCLKECVPAQVSGIAFLSGGQPDELATKHLGIMNKKFTGLPWRLTFSYGRGMQDEARKVWQGKAENVQAAQKVLLKRAEENYLASKGKL